MTENDLCSFRYRSINENSLNDLAESQLYFSPPHKLNDPSDLQIDFAKIQREIIDENKNIKWIIREPVIRKLHVKANNSGIVCFSDSPSNDKMWDKYASNSSGMCCTYRIPQSFIRVNKDQIIGWGPVRRPPIFSSSGL